MRRFLSMSIFWMFLVSSAYGESIKASDIAIILPKDKVGLGVKSGLLSPAWYEKVKDGFSRTSVGDALDNENYFDDWQIVSLRMVPCSPLGVSPKQNIDQYCWPEVRIVWQPILVKNNPGRQPNFADDRAIHALYDIDPKLYVSSAAAQVALGVKNEIASSLVKGQNPKISSSDLQAFTEVRNRTASRFLDEVMLLRSSAGFDAIEVRPEFQNGNTSKQFVDKLRNFLAKVAPRGGIKTLTAFSLPEGRDPSGIDEWVFLKFLGVDGQLKPVKIELFSAATAAKIYDFGSSPRGSMQRDDPALYDWLERNPNDEILKNVMVFGDKKSHSKIANRQEILVDNTSCASCHKLNTDKFNFHALSYLGIDELEVSPRVKKDVELDLLWIKSFLK
jgi:hypothetical protein